MLGINFSCVLSLLTLDVLYLTALYFLLYHWNFQAILTEEN